jgi:hypothetical protein
MIQKFCTWWKKGVRGGGAQCTKWYAEAKYKYTGNVDVEDSEYIAYLDANNLYVGQ